MVYYSMGKYKDAMEYLQRVLSGYKKIFTESHQIYAGIYVNIGDIYFAQEDYSKSLEYYQLSQEILLKYYPEDHRKVIAVKEKINEINSIINSNK